MSASTPGCPDAVPAEVAAPVDDLALMQAIATGDENALADLLSRYQQDVRTMVGRLTAWSSDSDDLVQDVFIQAWRQANSYQGHGTLRGWLLQIALNRCRNHHRTTKRIWQHLVRFAHQSSANQPREQQVEDPRWQLIQAALVQLSYRDRELLVLIYMEQQEVRTLAQQWSVSESSLYVRLHRARKRLLDRISKACETT